jgi:hypothetical protein
MTSDAQPTEHRMIGWPNGLNTQTGTVTATAWGCTCGSVNYTRPTVYNRSSGIGHQWPYDEEAQHASHLEEVARNLDARGWVVRFTAGR